MPHLPDSQHPDHDLELIAAYAAGDADGPRARARHRARRRVRRTAPRSTTTCARSRPRCPTLPAPARTRDFRLTPEQAAELRPKGIRGLLATLSGPRFSFATPVGTGLAALGIVGVLVASGGLPVGSGGDGRPAARDRRHPERPARPWRGRRGARVRGARPPTRLSPRHPRRPPQPRPRRRRRHRPSTANRPASTPRVAARSSTSTDPAAAACRGTRLGGHRAVHDRRSVQRPVARRPASCSIPPSRRTASRRSPGRPRPPSPRPCWLPAAMLALALGVALVARSAGAPAGSPERRRLVAQRQPHPEHRPAARHPVALDADRSRRARPPGPARSRAPARTRPSPPAGGTGRTPAAGPSGGDPFARVAHDEQRLAAVRAAPRPSPRRRPACGGARSPRGCRGSRAPAPGRRWSTTGPSPATDSATPPASARGPLRRHDLVGERAQVDRLAVERQRAGLGQRERPEVVEQPVHHGGLGEERRRGGPRPSGGRRRASPRCRRRRR